MQKTRDRPKKVKQKNSFSFKKVFDALKKEVKEIFKPKRAKAPKAEKPKAKKLGFKESFNKFKLEFKQAFTFNLLKPQNSPGAPKKQNGTKSGKVDPVKAVSGVLVTLAVIAVVSLIGGIGGGTKTVIKYKDKIVVEENNSGLNINGIVKTFEVNRGANVNAGDFVEFVTNYSCGEFNTATTKHISACKLDNNRVLVLYTDYGNFYYGTAVVLTLNNSTVTVGSEFVFNNNATQCISGLALSDNKVLITYSDEGNSYCGTASLLSIEGSTIEEHSKVVFNDTETGKITTVGLTNNSVLVTYRDSDAMDLMSTVLSINDSTINVGVEKQLANGSSATAYPYSYISSCALTDTKVLIIYQDYVNSKYSLKGLVVTIDNGIISYGVEHVLGNLSKSTNEISSVALTDNKAFIVCGQQAIAISISDTSITLGTASMLSTKYVSACALTESKVLVTYSNKGTVFSVDGLSLSSGDEIEFCDAATDKAIISFSDNSALVIYNDGALGAYQSLSIIDSTITVDDVSSCSVKIQPATSSLHNVGIAKTSGKEGDVIEVYCVQ